MLFNNITHNFNGVDYVVFDFETTGLGSDKKIIEIAAAKVRDDKIVATFETLINPEKQIPPKITKITGISDEMVETAPVLSDVLSKFLDFIGNDVLIGHHIDGFDYNILSEECYKILNITLNNNFVDTLYLSQSFLNKEVVENYTLERLCYCLDIKTTPNHRALQDVEATFELYKILKTLPKIKNIGEAFPKLSPDYIYSFDCSVDVKEKMICLSGDFFAFTPKQVEHFLIKKGAMLEDSNKLRKSSTNILLVGGKGSEEWKYGNYGNKVKQAMTWNEKGANIIIIKEEDFFKKKEVLENV